MAFPSVLATSASVEAANTLSHTVAVPNGSNVVGRRVVLVFCVDGTTAITWPAGWSVRATGLNNAGNGKMDAAERVIDGTEGFTGAGDTITVTTAASEGSSHLGYLVDGHDPAVAADATNNNQIGTGTNVDPPLLTPAGGAKDYLWIAFGCADGSAVAVSGFPAGYTNTLSQDAGGFIGGELAMGATLQLNAASEDPGAFTVTIARQRSGITLAITPAPAGGSIQPPRTMHQHRTRRAA